jgi:phosphoenolpyruvate carboxylase
MGLAAQNITDISDTFRDLYEKHAKAYNKDPFVSPILRLSLDIVDMLDEGSISFDELQDAVNKLTFDGLKTRARQLSSYIGSCSEEENTNELKSIFRSLAYKNGELISFSEFEKSFNTIIYGFVFTAHPTFTMPMEQATALAGYTAMISNADHSGSLEALKNTLALENKPLSLDEESDFCLKALDNLHTAFNHMFQALFEVSSELYPNEWSAFTPQLCSIATWVGFDMDGRKDIFWATTLEKRINLQVRQLTSYKETISHLIETYPKESTDLNDALSQIEDTLTIMKKHQAFFHSYCQDKDKKLNDLQKESKSLIESKSKRIISPDPLLKAVNKCLKNSKHKPFQIELMTLRAQLDIFGLSRAEVHFRINANQLHNAISSEISLNTHPDHPSMRRSYIDHLSSMLDQTRPANIDFGDIADEEMTAKYEFMLIQQIIKHIDQSSNIRFLIAETESAFTILTALYYAKRFGVDKHVDICPLFETSRAIQDSSRYIESLLETPSYIKYIHQRGRFCIQTGYSDAGRYLGQLAAGASIERLKERLLSLYDLYDLEDITLLSFDTHGESIGRGGHPSNFDQRLKYVSSPYFRTELNSRHIPFIQESSYQGGDGFIPFMTVASSLAILTRVLNYFLSPSLDDQSDPYYKEPLRSEVTKFFNILTNFQTSLIHNPHYADLLGAYSTNIMHKSGSRAVKRQIENKGPVKRPEVTQIRAIPHNAILCQYGLLANVLSGMGHAFREHSDLISELESNSPRLQSILSMLDHALSISDPQIMKAYISILDPTFWVELARLSNDENRSNKFAAIATILESHDFHSGMVEIYRKLDWDYVLLKRFRKKSQKQVSENIACLHAIRIALMRSMFLLATDIPRFGPHHPITRDQLLRTILHMDIDQVVELLNSIFPTREPKPHTYNFGEISEYRKQEQSEGYTNIQKDLVNPLKEMHKLSKDISISINHYIGFFG